MRALGVLLFLLIVAPTASAVARELPIEVGTNPDGSMYLRPAEMTVDLGDDVTMRVKNVDRTFHDVALLDYDGNDIEIEVPGQKTETYRFTASVAGDFRLICEVSGHKQKGMFGSLHVVDPKETPAGWVLGLVVGAAVAVALPRRKEG